MSPWQRSERLTLGAVALALGLMSAGGVWAFKRFIDLVHWLFFDGLLAGLAGLGGWTILLAPVLGGLIVGLIAHFWIGPERHHGVAGVIEAVALAGGRLRYARMPLKATAAAISLGSGASVGPEDPSVQIGANLGSMLGQVLHMSEERVRALVAGGAAAGIAAAFNAPLAGVFFALEIVLGEWGSGSVALVALTAVTSVALTQALAGPQPAFRVPAYALNSAWELPLYLGLGLLAGLVSPVYVRLIYAFKDFFERWLAPGWVKPVLGGAAVGVVGIVLPQVLGVGYETIGAILADRSFSIKLLLMWMVAKLVLTPLCVGSGFPGGVFAPALFIGATLGGAYGGGLAASLPGLDINPRAFAMVGMAAVLAGAVHAPLTGILLLFEMTNDYRIILPLMFAVVTSLVLSQHLQKDSVYTLGLTRKGIRLERGRDVEVLEGITVGEVMRPQHDGLRETQPLGEAAEALMRDRRYGLPVMDGQGRLAGIFTLQDLERAQAEQGWQTRAVGQVCSRDLAICFPDETVGAALRRMGARGVGRLPVVARSGPRQLVGMLRREDIIRAYDLALARKSQLRQRAQEVRLGAMSGAEVETIRLVDGSPCLGKAVKEITWPRDSVIAALHRGRQVLIPHGDTLLRPGDVLVIVADTASMAEVRRMCGADAGGQGS